MEPIDCSGADGTGRNPVSDKPHASSVESNLEYIAKQVGRVRSQVGNLQSSLDSVLRNTTTLNKPPNKDTVKQDQPCKLAGSLEKFGDELADLADQLNDIQNRLEL